MQSRAFLSDHLLSEKKEELHDQAIGFNCGIENHRQIEELAVLLAFLAVLTWTYCVQLQGRDVL